jgi:hypothetical protein
MYTIIQVFLCKKFQNLNINNKKDEEKNNLENQGYGTGELFEAQKIKTK